MKTFRQLVTAATMSLAIASAAIIWTGWAGSAGIEAYATALDVSSLFSVNAATTQASHVASAD